MITGEQLCTTRLANDAETSGPALTAVQKLERTEGLVIHFGVGEFKMEQKGNARIWLQTRSSCPAQLQVGAKPLLCGLAGNNWYRKRKHTLKAFLSHRSHHWELQSRSLPLMLPTALLATAVMGKKEGGI